MQSCKTHVRVSFVIEVIFKQCLLQELNLPRVSWIREPPITREYFEVELENYCITKLRAMRLLTLPLLYLKLPSAPVLHAQCTLRVL